MIFAGHQQARIVPIVRPKDDRVAMNGQWSVQAKGSLITQKLKTRKGGADMIVWISKQGLQPPVEDDGMVFVEAPFAYAVIRPLGEGYTLLDLAGGKAVVLKDEFAPVILEVMAKTDIASLDAFKAKVKRGVPQHKDSQVSYTTIYGDTLALHTDYSKAPSINGQPVNYTPTKAFDSPFLFGDWNSGVVTIQKGKRKKVLDFR